eukprot:GILI01012873.1.p1 GENE.GILI01012873.1~~GILI01012873.1.p1  ORF type:complete len:181 (-),score=35.54 GILI01012873.1:30-572(-)
MFECQALAQALDASVAQLGFPPGLLTMSADVLGARFQKVSTADHSTWQAAAHAVEGSSLPIKLEKLESAAKALRVLGKLKAPRGSASASSSSGASAYAYSNADETLFGQPRRSQGRGGNRGSASSGWQYSRDYPRSGDVSAPTGGTATSSSSAGARPNGQRSVASASPPASARRPGDAAQ